ncbi:MAG: hypothetical protein ACREHG_06870 [Candidatus Saccharimonadales bacterium]
MKNLKFFLSIFLMVGILNSCHAQSWKSSTEQPLYDIWNILLHQYVNDKGMVNYKGFIHDKARLDKFLKQLSTNAPDAKR